MARKKAKKKKKRISLRKGECKLVNPGYWKYKYARCICRDARSGVVRFSKTDACASRYKRSQAAKKAARRRRKRR